ncbi:hypothetical protein AN958_06059 [Leucoagaricus sp. SymC.cos]|nr:hypothetical protein AN958_06059 [Leucoagaricus sp. SymC.cos]
MHLSRPPQFLNILTIPLELSHRILIFCHPYDVAAFSRTCRLAYELVQDEYLWQRLWHSYSFDNPQLVLETRRAVALIPAPESHPSSDGWKLEFTRRMRAELVATKTREQYALLSSRDKREALQVFVSVLEESLPAFGTKVWDGTPVDLSCSENVCWVQRVLQKSRLIAPVFLSLEDEKEISELQARIRSCMDEFEWGGKTRRATADRRNRSRAFVYDLRNYGYTTAYGPYRADGRVNWTHVEHLVNVVLSNLNDLPSHIVTPARPPFGLDSLRPYTAPGKYSPRDWAGVEGTWRRYVCFMDYRDLFDGPLHPKFFEDPRFREATRLIEVKLHIVPRSQIRHFPSSEILDESTSPIHPTTFFVGSSKGANGNEATIEGFVWVASDRTVRWKLKVSIYDHSPQWSSTGVQIGDVGSARGVAGVWTTTLHEQGDPVGPFWLWKVEDNCSEDLVEYT